MDIPILQTKLHKPISRPNLVHRRRLIEKLEEGITARRIMTLVTGPAGYGKTTLITDWLQETGHKCAWLSLDEDDNDLNRFIHYLVAAIKEVAPSFGQSALSIMKSVQIPMRGAVSTTLINELLSIDFQFVLVIDDYHVIHKEGIHSFVELLLENQIPNLHLLMLTRLNPPLPIARLRARGQMTDIRMEELRFQTEEAEDFFHNTISIRLDAEHLEKLTKYTEGWAAGLQLAGLSLQGRDKDQTASFLSAFGGKHRDIVDYLGHEVLGRLDKETLDFIVKTSIPDRLNAALCERLTGRTDSGELLGRLDRSNLFLVSLDDSQNWYRYHRLFRDFLKSSLDDETEKSLHSKASSWFREHNLIEEAIKHALLANNRQEAVEMIRESVDNVFQRGFLTTISGWLDKIPEDLIRTNGELAFAKSEVLYFSGQVKSAERYLGMAEHAWENEGNDGGIGRVLTLKCQFTVAQSRTGDKSLSTTILHMSNRALQLLDEKDHLYRGFALIIQGNSKMRLGDIIGAVESLRESLRLGEMTEQPAVAIAALSDLISTLMRQGALGEAYRICSEAIIRHVDPKGNPLPIASVAYFHLASLEYALNRIDKAETILAKGIELCRKHGWITLLISALVSKTSILRALGKNEQAVEVIHEMRKNANAIGYQNEIVQTRLTEVNFYLALGKKEPYDEWAAGIDIDEIISSLEDCCGELECLTYIRGLIAHARYDDAYSILVKHDKWAETNGFNGSRITNKLLQTKAMLGKDNLEAALSCFNKALELAAPENNIRPFIDENLPLAELTVEAAHTHKAFAQSLLADAGSNDAVEREPASIEVPELSKRELQILEMVCRGLSNQEIAERSFIALSTVKTHINKIYAKLAVKSRTQAAARALELRIFK